MASHYPRARTLRTPDVALGPPLACVGMSGRLRRGAWFALGWLAVGVGSIGIVVPGLPTTVFFVVAAACFSRAQPPLRAVGARSTRESARWFGTTGPGWACHARAKVAAVASIAVVCSLSAFVAVERWWLRLVILGAGAVGIALDPVAHPDPPRHRPTAGPDRALVPDGRHRGGGDLDRAAVAMAVKYVGSGTEDGVHVVGPIHGVVVLGYVAVTLLAAWRLRWSGRPLALALLASVPPLATLVFEAWATQTGHLSAVPVGDRPGP